MFKRAELSGAPSVASDEDGPAIAVELDPVSEPAAGTGPAVGVVVVVVAAAADPLTTVVPGPDREYASLGPSRNSSASEILSRGPCGGALAEAEAGAGAAVAEADVDVEDDGAVTEGGGGEVSVIVVEPSSPASAAG